MIYLCQGQGHLPIRKCHWRRHHRPLLLIIPLPHPPSSPAPPPPALLKLGSPTFIVQAGESSVGLAPRREEGRCPPRMLPSSFPNYQGNPTLSALYCHITLSHKERNKEIEREVEFEWETRCERDKVGACEQSNAHMVISKLFASFLLHQTAIVL